MRRGLTIILTELFCYSSNDDIDGDSETLDEQFGDTSCVIGADSFVCLLKTRGICLITDRDGDW